MTKSLYDILEVNKKASQSDIKKAYRKKAMENHPDKGGDQRIFSELYRAYAIISNPKKRKLYDDTGKISENEDGKLIDALINLFYGAIELLIKDDAYCYTDLIVKMKEMILDEQTKRSAEIDNLKQKERIFENIKKRISKKNKNDNNIFVLTLENQISELNNRIDKINDTIDLGNKMRDFLKDYKYSFDKKKEHQFTIKVDAGNFENILKEWRVHN